MRRIVYSGALALSLALSGCSYIKEILTPEQKPSSSSAPHRVETPIPQNREGISLTWEVPSEPVDGFVIRYGAKPGQMDNEIKVAIADLKQEQDDVYGPVYRYTVPDVPRNQPLFAAIAAFKGDRISNFGDALPARGD